MDKVASLIEAKSRKEKRDYSRLVMQAWDDAEHEDARKVRECATEANQIAREKL